MKWVCIAVGLVVVFFLVSVLRGKAAACSKKQSRQQQRLTSSEYKQLLLSRREELEKRIRRLKQRQADLETRINNTDPAEVEVLTKFLRERAMTRQLILSALHERRKFEDYLAEVRKRLAEKVASADNGIRH